jgi:DNA ligase-1
MKSFKDGEFKVKDIVIGNIRIINKDSGLEETIETMVSVIIDYKGYDVNVGSGFSLSERKFYYLNSSQIIDKMITVQYFGESNNEQGGLSLRFPTFKVNHGIKRMT